STSEVGQKLQFRVQESDQRRILWSYQNPKWIRAELLCHNLSSVYKPWIKTINGPSVVRKTEQLTDKFQPKANRFLVLIF
ncbi:hypothetical protein, partial [Acinetobacter baumannii]|uniref:hypothetical protein n=1 Tax=Acinetobacter baumannii TaxID=470 RepID=UPI001C06EFB2